jgi:hypothetical protein
MPLGKTIKFSKIRTQSPVGHANKAWKPYWTSHRGMETLLENLKRIKNLVKKLSITGNPFKKVAEAGISVGKARKDCRGV